MTQITNPHLGVSAARNTGFDAGTGDWVMFCDSDDSVFTTHTLFHFWNEMKKENINMVVCEFEAEQMDKNGVLWSMIRDGSDFIFVHGKAIRRKWLEDNDVRFDPELTIHEDSYFVSLARIIMPPNEVSCIKQGPLYGVYWNPDSVCRKSDNAIDNTFLYKTYDQFFKKSDALIRELIKRGKSREAIITSSQALCDTYVNSMRASWRGRDCTPIEEYAREFYKRHKDLVDMATEQTFLEGVRVAQGILEKQQDLTLGTVTFWEWLRKIKE